MKNRYQSRESELLGNLQEECLEVAKVISKIMRFSEEGQPISAQKLAKLNAEIGDVVGCLELLSKEDHSIINLTQIELGKDQKIKKLCDPERMSHLKG